jgi:uncharacterized membrane protein HdeD (DUF308 family)
MSLSRPLDGTGTLPSFSHMTWLGFGLMALGVLAILSPLVAGEAVVTIIGVILFAAGIGQLYQGFSSKSGWDRLLTLILGVMTALCAFFVFANPLAGLAFLTLLLVLFFVADGLWKIVASFNYRPASGWLWLFGSGVLSLVLGLLIWSQWPVSGMWAVGVLLGVNLLSTGAALVALAGSLKHDVNRLASAVEDRRM